MRLAISHDYILKVKICWIALAIFAVAAACLSLRPCDAADISAATEQGEGNSHQNSILVFAGRMSTTDDWSTMILNLNYHSGGLWDNYIVGAAYDRDLVGLGHGWYLARRSE